MKMNQSRTVMLRGCLKNIQRRLSQLNNQNTPLSDEEKGQSIRLIYNRTRINRELDSLVNGK